ncbi:MAG TPA: DNA polymerase/3'-5' exonuclease PolX [Sedimentisphaerales bacterium]|nr:DNA polymerase/3'-5' exonuclease PolX [Sedimentisphaerales bacterium]
MKNAILSELFDEMADVMEILGEDRFRINSYRKVGRVIGDMPTDVETLLASGQLAKIPGIGKSSLAKIEEFVKTGTITAHQELLKKIPPTLLELLTVPGMGPKGVKAVYEKLNVTSIAQLKGAIKNGSLATLPGFGDKKAAVITRGIEFLEKSTGRIRLDQALEAAEMVTYLLRELSGTQRIQAASSLRRRAETIGDVDILVASGKSKKASERIVEGFTSAGFVEEVLAAGPTKGSAIIQTETTPVQVDVRVVPKESFGAAAQYFAGSKEHNVRLREIAIKAKLKLNEYGLFKADKMIAGPVEEEIYQKLGLDYIEPLLREDRGEVEAAKTNSLPELIEIGDIKGDFHVHTIASDGDCDISEIARAAKEIGYKYICITDHSRSSAIANGLSAERLAQQIKEIRKLNEKLQGITILAGTEVDILANGSLDFDDKLLAELDFVIASIHSGMASPREKVTTRTLKAMDNTYVNCIGHPTGRLIGQREAMDLDIAAVIKHASQTNTALEVNANPWRLDLKDIHCRMAIESGVKLVIGTDAHSVAGLGLMGFGVATVARGWATKDNVLNTLSAAKIKSWVKSKRP